MGSPAPPERQKLADFDALARAAHSERRLG
jgi:hypothetical protein